MIFSSIFKIKDELMDEFVKNLEEHINIVLTGQGFFVYTDDDGWPIYRYQPEDQSYHDWDLAEAIAPYLADNEIVLLPDGPGSHAGTAVTAQGDGFNYTFPCSPKAETLLPIAA